MHSPMKKNDEFGWKFIGTEKDLEKYTFCVKPEIGKIYDASSVGYLTLGLTGDQFNNDWSYCRPSEVNQDLGNDQALTKEDRLKILEIYSMVYLHWDSTLADLEEYVKSGKTKTQNTPCSK